MVLVYLKTIYGQIVCDIQQSNELPLARICNSCWH